MAILHAHRVFLFGLACLHVFMTSGVIHGWTALVHVFVEEGIYAYKCDVMEYGAEGDRIPCVKEVAHLNLIYTLSGLGNCGSNLLFGYLMDTYGMRISGILSLSLFAAGCFSISLYKVLVADSILVGFLLLGFAGPATQLPSFVICNLFPTIKGTLTSVSTAFFDASCLIFIIFEFLYYMRPAIFNTFTLFLGYGIFVIVLAVSALLFWSSESEKELKSKEQGFDNVESSTSILKSQIISMGFLYIVLYTSIHTLRLNFVIGTIRDQLYSRLGSQTTAQKLSTIFGLMLPFGFVIIPAVGYLLDKKGFTWSFCVINAANILWGSLWMINNVPVLIVSFVIFATTRQMVFGSGFTYLAVKFGYENFGVLSGLNNVVVGIFPLLQFVIVWITLNWLGGNWIYANVTLLLLPLPLFFFPCFVKEVPKEQEEERIPLITPPMKECDQEITM